MENFLQRSPRFRREIGEWVQTGIITPEQAQLLHERYQLDREAPWYAQSGFVLKAVALVLAGMALFLFIAENWDSFPLAARAATGIVPLLCSYAVGVYYHTKRVSDKAELAFFFSSLVFGGNIFLQAQIFHISAYYPNGLLWWILGALPFAVYYRSTLHNLLLHVLYFIWVSTQMPLGQFSWMSPILLATLLYLLWQSGGTLVLLLAIVNIYVFFMNANDGLFAAHVLDFPLLFSAITFLCIVALPLVHKHYSKAVQQRVAVLLHGMLLAFFLFLTFKDATAEILTIHSFTPLTYGIIAAALFGFFLQKKEAMGIYSLAVFAPLFGIHLLGVLHVDKALSGLVAVMANILFFGYALWHIIGGLQERVKSRFMSGVFLVLLLAIVRYMDYFESYVMMSIVFLLCSGLLWGVHTWWNKTASTLQTEATDGVQA